VIALKAIIVDFDGDYLIVANSRGDFKRIYNNYSGCQIGDEIAIKESRAASFWSMLSSKRVLALAACFLFMFITSYGIYGYVNPVTFVTVDINPSVELSLNRYDVVIDARGLNEEGNNIIGDGREYRNMKFDKALNLLLSRAVKAEYLNKDANTVMLTVSNIIDSIPSNKKKQLQEIAKTQLDDIIEREAKNTSSSKQQDPKALTTESVVVQDTNKKDINIIVEDTTYEKHQEAKKMDISQGKLALYEKLKKIKPDLALNYVKEASIGQLIKEIETVKLELKDKSRARPNVNSDNKKQQTNDKKQWINEDKQQQRDDIKQLKKHAKEQLKNIKEDHKNQLKEKMKDAQEQLKKTIKEKKKDISKEIKKELKNKIDTDIRQQYKNDKKDKKKVPHIFNDKIKINKNSSKNNKNKK